MVSNKHQEDSTDGKMGENGLEAMILSFECMASWIKRHSEYRAKEHCGQV